MKLFNTLSRRKETFKPLKRGEVSFYSCGPTVYNFAHIGNLRTYVFADILQRALEFNKYNVRRVMNITDVGHLTSDADEGEDKMEKGAKKEGKTPVQIASFYTKAFFKDLDLLNIKKPRIIVKATDAIPEQIKIIKQLEKKGFTYETSSAVYFDVSKLEDYGKLSGQKLSEKEVAARKEVIKDSEKRNPQDFALWFKLVGRHKDHVLQWNSPWGKGFPGWHIECSAIATKKLGQPFDIHTGGIDHIGTHHANEIAQSEAAYGKPLANVWMHGEFLVIDKGKMSKSADNFITLQTVIDKGFDPLAYRYLILTAHYRSQLMFSDDSMVFAQTSYDNLLDKVGNLEGIHKDDTHADPKAESQYRDRFKRYMDDDLNTPQALNALREMVIGPYVDAKTKHRLIKEFDSVLGLDLIAQSRTLQKQLHAIPQRIRELARKRWDCKLEKKYKEADEIRLRLEQKGYEINDKDDSYEITKKIV